MGLGPSTLNPGTQPVKNKQASTASSSVGLRPELIGVHAHGLELRKQGLECRGFGCSASGLHRWPMPCRLSYTLNPRKPTGLELRKKNLLTRPFVFPLLVFRCPFCACPLSHRFLKSPGLHQPKTIITGWCAFLFRAPDARPLTHRCGLAHQEQTMAAGQRRPAVRPKP